MKIIELNEANIPELFLIEQAAHLSPWNENLIHSSFGNRKHNYGIFKKGKLLGYYFSEFVLGEMMLENICVDPEFQGQGVGRQLIEHLIELASSLNSEALFLEVRESNGSAIALYNKVGFEQVGFRKNYYSIVGSDQRETALLMKKSFS